MPKTLIHRTLPWIVVALASWSTGCSSNPKPDSRTVALEVASQIDGINYRTRDRLDKAMLKSIETLEREITEQRLAARATVVQRFDAATNAERPVVALIDLWWNAAMLRDSARNGELRSIFGSEADAIQSAAEKAYEQIYDLAAHYLTEAQLADVREKIEIASKDQEILSQELATSIATGETEIARSGGGGNLFTDILSLPLSPFTAARSVETGVAEVVLQAQAFNRQFSRLPEQSRAQAERLLNEFYLSPLARSTVENMDKLGDASTSLAKTADTLPDKLRAEILAILEDSKESQQTISRTVADARATAEQVNAAISGIGDQAAALDGTIREAAAAGATWTETADAVERVLAAVERIQGPPLPPDAPPVEPSFSFEQLETSAVRLQAAATEIQGVLDRVLELVDENSAQRIEGLADRTLREATASGQQLVDAIFWRSLGVVGLAGAGLVAFAAVRRAS